MRLPVTPQISTKDGVSNKNARMTNVLKETRATGELACVRPGLSLDAQASGVGGGLVVFNNELVSVYGTTLGIGLAIVADDSIGSITPASGTWSYYTVYGVASNGETVVAVPYADVATRHFYTSTDGVNWTARQIYPSGGTTWYTIVNDGAMFVAAEQQLANLYTSVDGISWVKVPFFSAGANCSVFVYLNGIYCFLFDGLARITSDFGGYQQNSLPGFTSVFAACVSDSLICAFQFNKNFCLTSPDGVSWTTSGTLPASTGWVAVAWNGERFCAITTSLICATSVDGVTWTTGTLPSTSYVTISSIEGTFIAAKDGYVATSSDGLSWTEVATGFNKTPSYKSTTLGSYFITAEYGFSTTTPATQAVSRPVNSPVSVTTVLGNASYDFAQSPL